MHHHNVSHIKGGFDLDQRPICQPTATDNARAVYKAAEAELRGMMTAAEWDAFQDEIYGGYREMTAVVNGEIERRQMAADAADKLVVLDMSDFEEMDEYYGTGDDGEPFEWTTTDGIFQL